jgi:hypothetical protein
MDLTQLTDEQVTSLANVGNFAAIAELNRRSAMPSAIEKDILRDQQGNIITFNIPQNNFRNYSDSELMESDTTSNLGILDIFKDYIQGGGMFGAATRGITSLKNMLGDAFKGSRFYNAMGETGQRIFAPGSRAGDAFNLNMRRDANRISNMLQRGAAGKNFSQRNLDNVLGKFGITGVDTGGMIDSIAESAQTGYGGYGSSEAAAEAAASGGRDYSESPGAMAGDMEYGEE